MKGTSTRQPRLCGDDEQEIRVEEQIPDGVKHWLTGPQDSSKGRGRPDSRWRDGTEGLTDRGGQRLAVL